MTQSAKHASANPDNVSTFRGLAPLILSIFLGYFSVSVPLGPMALEIRERLGFGSATIGGVIGLQSLATLLTRHWAGTLCDSRGPRHVILIGLPLAALSGLAYALAGVLDPGRFVVLETLIFGRLLMGLAESLFLTGLMSWGIARLGAARTGVVMSWTGMALYAAIGLGAASGLTGFESGGLTLVGFLMAAAPVLVLGCILPLRPVAPSGGGRTPFHKVLGMIWRFGAVLALATIPYAALSAFLTLDYYEHGWSHAGAGFAAFAVAYIAVRLFAAGLPDRIGAMRVALGSLALETIGQVLLWSASRPEMAVTGAAITGLGFSLVFPSMGVLALNLVPPSIRGRALGNFIAFADIALGVTGPIMGLAISYFTTGTAFLIGALATIAALCLVPGMHRQTAKQARYSSSGRSASR
ncbi:MFS transporter [Asaia krungthepensis]|uniref:Major facilitator superfamily transporter n=1 Tax=Asaia krungthepensis NRIC 0535 TaxID=1307925 RepID=A0ABQ0Q3E0_9PROT|nr:MFS transporter [Asaia krungthepensis]GBQ89467.1 major facilitator superfamily transporter [Asaia krungthepensis NRIC 0535]